MNPVSSLLDYHYFFFLDKTGRFNQILFMFIRIQMLNIQRGTDKTTGNIQNLGRNFQHAYTSRNYGAHITNMLRKIKMNFCIIYI